MTALTPIYRGIIKAVFGATLDPMTGDWVGVREDVKYDVASLPPAPAMNLFDVVPYGARPVSPGFKMIAAKPGQLCWLHAVGNEIRLDVYEGVYAEECPDA